MTLAAGLLAALSTAAYVVCLWLMVQKQTQTFAGVRALNVAAVALFVLSRVFAQSAAVAMIASIAIAAALVAITRRSNLLGGVLAAAPLIAMLFTVDRTFFGGSVDAQFKDATLAALCVPGPFALGLWLTSLSRRKRGYRKRSAR